VTYSRTERSCTAPLALLALALCFAATRTADAKEFKVVGVQNTTGQRAAALHITFSGGQGRVTVAPPVSVFPNRGGCGSPAFPRGDEAGTVTINWGAACVQPYATVWFTAFARRGPLVFVGGTWTGANGDTLGTITADHVQVSEMPTRPVVPRALLIAIAVLLAMDAILIFALSRRRRTRAAQ
jgi:hypothetical protein